MTALSAPAGVHRLLACAAGTDLVFLDPDNGFEVPSAPIGRKNSCKYAAWPEVERLYADGSSLLAFQFKKVMEETRVTVRRLSAEVRERTGCAQLEVFDAPDVIYFLIAQPRHAGVFAQAVTGPPPTVGHSDQVRDVVAVATVQHGVLVDSSRSWSRSADAGEANRAECAHLVGAVAAHAGNPFPAAPGLGAWSSHHSAMSPMLLCPSQC